MLNENQREEIAEKILDYTICDEEYGCVKKEKDGKYSKYGGGLVYLVDFRTNVNFQENLKDYIKFELDYITDVKIVEIDREYMKLEIYTEYGTAPERIVLSVDDEEYNYLIVEWEEEE